MAGWARITVKDVQALNVPVIVHEMGQWCVYPNFDEVRKYTGPLKPKNFDIFRDSLAEHGMLDQWRDFLRASGKLQALCYKEEIEAALRTPGIGGFELLDLHDFPGQGTALVGVLDPFWESKGYITPAAIPPLLQRDRPAGARAQARLDDRRDLLRRGRGRALRPRAAGERRGRLEAGVGTTGRRWPKASSPPRPSPWARALPLGRRRGQAWRNSTAPQACKLVVGLKGTPFENDWNVWIYPSKPEAAAPDRCPGHAAPRPGSARAAGCRRPGAAAPAPALAPAPAPRLRADLLEPLHVPHPGPPDARPALRPEAPRAGQIPHRVLPGLAVG